MARGPSRVDGTLVDRFRYNAAGVSTINNCSGSRGAVVCFIMGHFRVSGVQDVVRSVSRRTCIAVDRITSIFGDATGSGGVGVWVVVRGRGKALTWGRTFLFCFSLV